MSESAAGGRWLLLIHQIPRKPDYLRVKIGRRLAKLGAVAIKNSVYALPRVEHAHEDLQWIRREIVEGGGEASVCAAQFIDGLRDDELEELFHRARNAEYGTVADEARQAIRPLGRRVRLSDTERDRAGDELARLRRRVDEIAAIDFFDAPGRQAADEALAALDRRLRPPAEPAPDPAPPRRPPPGTTWVTRQGIHVDRMASAWLVRRFIDTDARFRFVPPKGHAPAPGEVRFDMLGAEFTHVGNGCTFETLASRLLDVPDTAVTAIGQIVHDLDLRDGRFGRPETAGIGLVITGLCLTHAEDAARLEAGCTLFDALYAACRRRPRA